MATIRIMLAPVDILANAWRDLRSERAAEAIMPHLQRYEISEGIATEKTGEDAAEEAFDLTNNPMRQEERERVYGRGRSVSVGDVIDVDGKMFLCSSIGWKVLA